jgi:hypothetical protein
MKVYKADWGWFIGNFDPSVLKTPDFEVGYLVRKKNEKHDHHYHKIAKEYNYLIKGSLFLHDQVLSAPCIFVIEPWEISEPKFLTDCHILCVKVPSLPGDKYEIR